MSEIEQRAREAAEREIPNLLNDRRLDGYIEGRRDDFVAGYLAHAEAAGPRWITIEASYALRVDPACVTVAADYERGLICAVRVPPLPDAEELEPPQTLGDA